MLKNPVSVTDILEGNISPESVFELRNALERQGKRVEFEFGYTAEKVWGEYFRCCGCGLSFEWHEGVLRGGRKNDRRNQCRECYRVVYWFHTKANQYKSLGRHTAKERQRQDAHDLYGGWYWSYMIETINNEGVYLLYFGATENMVSRKREHYMLSSNPETRNLFESKKALRLKNLFAFIRPITFNVWAHDTIEEAYRHEKKRWEFWSQRDNAIILNDKEPLGIPPKGVYDSVVVNKEPRLGEEV